jgi:hypothetical protein
VRSLSVTEVVIAHGPWAMAHGMVWIEGSATGTSVGVTRDIAHAVSVRHVAVYEAALACSASEQRNTSYTTQTQAGCLLLTVPSTQPESIPVRLPVPLCARRRTTCHSIQIPEDVSGAQAPGQPAWPA